MSCEGKWGECCISTQNMILLKFHIYFYTSKFCNCWTLDKVHHHLWWDWQFKQISQPSFTLEMLHHCIQVWITSSQNSSQTEPDPLWSLWFHCNICFCHSCQWLNLFHVQHYNANIRVVIMHMKNYYSQNILAQLMRTFPEEKQAQHS